jgi:CRP/FNR family nitrogen fixation transcriptional regulator
LRLRNDRTGPTATAQLDFIGTVMRYPPNVEVYGEGEPTDYFYKVLSGAVRTSKFLHDGRRQIGGFYLRDELFGLDFGDQHPFSAETITETKVLVIKRSSAISLSARNPEVAHQLFAMTARELQRMQDHVVLLIKSAQERVATFLLEMADRNPTQEEVIELPMLRQDIADYLGLTVETISRTLSMLEASGAIKLATSRRIVLRDRSALVQLNGSEDHESRH